MKTLTAKPIIKNQYWVVTDGDKKVGNVLANNFGFVVNLNGVHSYFENSHELKKNTKIEFQTLQTTKGQVDLPFAKFPTTPKTYNNMFDVKRKLHLFTKTQKSKCYYAAGYFIMNQNGENEIVFCPKYIFVQRYKYLGPYKTVEEANSMINKL